MPELRRTDLSAEYATTLLNVLEQRSIPRERALAGTGIRLVQLEENQRLSPEQDAALLENAVKLADDPGLGYEIGLRSTVTSHGLLGYGLMSCATLGEALQLWSSFLDLRTTTCNIQMHEHGDIAALEIHDLAPGLPMRSVAVDRLATMTARLIGQLTQQALPQIEMWHRDDEPAFYEQYRHRLFNARFATGIRQIRFPAFYLKLPLTTANAVTLRLVKEQCERDRARLGRPDDLVLRIKDMLERLDSASPSIEDTAKVLCMSSRTLKRKLHRQGFSFRHLVDDVRRSAALRDVLNPVLSVDQIATRMGYADPSNLTRAFRRWTGEAPSQYRARLLNLSGFENLLNPVGLGINRH